MRRRAVIIGAAGTLAAAAWTLALGAWRSGGVAPEDPYRPPLDRMDWRLTDHTGRSIVAADWLGQPAMIFFGFTWCPDICPTTLSDISLWMEELGPEADQFTVALITVDPARDTPTVLADYLSSFDPRILGLTGSQIEIDRAAESFRVQYERVAQDRAYTMNHTAGVFLFDRGGRFVSIIDFHEDRRYALPKLHRALR